MEYAQIALTAVEINFDEDSIMMVKGSIPYSLKAEARLFNLPKSPNADDMVTGMRGKEMGAEHSSPFFSVHFIFICWLGPAVHTYIHG